MTSQKPYLIRAIYEWCKDNGLTPYIIAIVNKHTVVPQSYVVEGQIVLNIAPDAVKDINFANDLITVKATFSGIVYDLVLPVANIVAIFAKENNQGLQFTVTNLDDDSTLIDKKNTSNSGIHLIK